MKEETIKIGNWDVPKTLYHEYVKFRTFADAYALKDPKVTRNGSMLEQEIGQRWLLCTQKVMEIHRQICKVIGVAYSEEPDDEFYRALHSETEHRIKRFNEE